MPDDFDERLRQADVQALAAFVTTASGGERDEDGEDRGARSQPRTRRWRIRRGLTPVRCDARCQTAGRLLGHTVHTPKQKRHPTMAAPDSRPAVGRARRCHGIVEPEEPSIINTTWMC